MSRDCTESTAAKTSAVDIYGVLNHFVCRNTLSIILGMRKTCVWKTEHIVHLFRCHWRIRRIHYNILAACFLQQTLCVYLIRFFFDVAEVFCLGFLVLQAFLVRVKHDVVIVYASGNFLFPCHVYRLRNFLDVTYRTSVLNLTGKLHYGALTHSVDNHVGARIA